MGTEFTEGKKQEVRHADDGQAQVMIAPFVAKTFHVVSDPATDALVRWGSASNTFLVLDPAAFSDLLLPSYFKHRNFASFVRQLNTYGFRKVDTDRWEFAHESFLRGQTQLLPLILRKKKSKGSSTCKEYIGEEAGEICGTIQEVRRLRHEQRAMEEELQAMDRRLQATESRPGQMMSFLAKLADDPDVVLRAMLAKKQELDAETSALPNKKRRLELVGSCAPGAGADDCDGIGDSLEPECGGLEVELAQSRAVPFPFSALGNVFY